MFLIIIKGREKTGIRGKDGKLSSKGDIIQAARWRRLEDEVIFESRQQGESCEVAKSPRNKRIKNNA